MWGHQGATVVSPGRLDAPLPPIRCDLDRDGPPLQHHGRERSGAQGRVPARIRNEAPHLLRAFADVEAQTCPGHGASAHLGGTSAEEHDDVLAGQGVVDLDGQSTGNGDLKHRQGQGYASVPLSVAIGVLLQRIW